MIRGKRIGGRDRVEPEVIEGEIIFYVDHVCMLRLYAPYFMLIIYACCGYVDHVCMLRLYAPYFMLIIYACCDYVLC